MRRLVLAALTIVAACAAPTNTARTQQSLAQESASQPASSRTEARSEAIDRGDRLPLAKTDPAVCKASWKRLEAELASAAAGCRSDEDCEEFMTCDTVTKLNAARLWKLRDEAKAACRGVAGTDSENACAFSPPQCRQGRCQRS